MDESIIECYQYILTEITSKYDDYLEDKENFIKIHIKKCIQKKNKEYMNEEFINIIFKKIIQDIYNAIIDYEEFFT